MSKARAGIQEAYGCFAQALAIHDDWEKIYISNIDFKALDTLAEETVGKSFGRRENGERRQRCGPLLRRRYGKRLV